MCFLLPKNESTRKAQIANINQKESTLPKNVYLNLFIQVPYLSKFAYPSALIPRKIHCPKKFLVMYLFLVIVKYF